MLKKKPSHACLVSAILCLLAISQVHAEMTMEQMEKMASGFRNTCVNKVGVDVARVDGMRKGEYPDDPKLACYTQCIMKLLRTFKNGHVDIAMVLKQVDMMMPSSIKERVSAATRKCDGLPEADNVCDTVYNFVKCNYNADPEVFFFP